jgi:hypothetical protein
MTLHSGIKMLLLLTRLPAEVGTLSDADWVTATDILERQD